MTMQAQEMDEQVYVGYRQAKWHKPAAALKFEYVEPELFPDVTEEEMDAIFAKPRVWYGERDEDGPDEMLYQTTRGQYR